MDIGGLNRAPLEVSGSFERTAHSSDRGGVGKVYGSVKGIVSRALFGPDTATETAEIELKPRRPDLVITIPEDDYQFPPPSSLVSTTASSHDESRCPEVVIDMSHIDDHLSPEQDTASGAAPSKRI